MFRQGSAIRDYVLPLIARPGRGQRLLGTGFVVGDHGGLLTAAHVVAGVPVEDLRALVVDDTEWAAVSITSVDVHPTEDVAFLTLEGGPWTSFFVVSSRWEGASADYQLWGYPADVAREIVVGDRIVDRPDLVYSTGHIRRRVAAGILPAPLRGALFELSTPGGSGTSGSPLVLRHRSSPLWPVIGINVGDRRTNDLFVGYAAMAEAFASWQPANLNRSIAEESVDVDFDNAPWGPDPRRPVPRR